MPVPFVIYADFESLIILIHTTQPLPKESYTNKIQMHKPSSFCYNIKCDFDDSYSNLSNIRQPPKMKMWLKNLWICWNVKLREYITNLEPQRK